MSGGGFFRACAVTIVAACAACSSFSSADGPPADAGIDAADGAPVVIVDAAPPLEQDAGADATVPAGGKLVFVSGTKLVPKQSLDVQRADALCGVIASAAQRPGTYVAWISAGASTAYARLGVAPGRRWFLADGTPVVDDTRLFAGELLHPIDEHVDGTPAAAGTLVWTGTEPSGVTAGANCNGFQNDAKGDEGLVGNTSKRDGAWTHDRQLGCELPADIYCFER